MRRVHVLLLVVAVVPAAHCFFWGCNVQTVNLPTDRAVLKQMINDLFPARLYLRKMGNNEERRYSCVKISITGHRSLGTEVEWGGRSPEARADETLPFNAMLTYMETEEQDSATLIHNRIFQTSLTGIAFEGVPVTMFQSDDRTKRASLTLTHITSKYGVFDACQTGFLGFSNTRSSYMFVNDRFNATNLDHRCMAKGLTELTGVSAYFPAGIC